ncbi:hypothetical protein F441_04583 [Phytophthora nicotianae CJ01A1]|uniref:Uncharacterized protein n=2 Tax=Phytophthora nicotianae TaxID=4792 RepID=W2JI68_PHYNI|nr:hypothetical protein L916_04451 [Phytophthora nicotianae]ETM51801.1 hypothetical protein L914_04425 [Phytophthora nicotianae]ETP22009.1 hypothetical protein F441_04583 [Phytophthora nicotianae CJ01A1]
MTTCRGVTKQGAPCPISFDLNTDSFCKYHTPHARQCLGISRTSGQRCKLKWDLDDSGYCVHHRSQASTPPTTAIPNACRGLTKRGTPCSVSWGLNLDGYCKYHAPNAAQCKGLARATGRRCKIKWGLDDRGYCQFHRRLDAPVSKQCEAVAAATGRRCTQTVGIDGDGFCTAHRMVTAELPMCQGMMPGSSEPCRYNAKIGYDYCCAAHDPQYATSYVAPSVFNDPGLRSSVEGDIVKLFRSRDLYHGDKLDLNTVGAVELDHILEKQCFAYAIQNLEFRDGDEEAQDMAFMLREEVVNELPNLCLTRATTNKIKGAAVSKFLDDSLTGHRGSTSFTDYLLAEKRDDTRLSRDVTRTIRSEMGSALQRCQRKLAEMGETPAFDALGAELQQLYVDMDLRAAYGGKTKPRVVKEEVKVDFEDKDDEYVLVDSASTDSWTVVDIKRTVKVEKRRPTLSVDAKPFVPGIGLSTPDSQKNVKAVAIPCKLEPDEITNFCFDSKANIAIKPANQEAASKVKATVEQQSSESTSEDVKKAENKAERR